MHKSAILFSLLLTWTAGVVHADDPSPTAPLAQGKPELVLDPTPDFLMSDIQPGTSLADRMWVQLMSGAVFSPNPGLGSSDIPTLDLAPTNLRLGLSLGSLEAENQCRGNMDLIVELSVWPIFKGYGNIVIGPAALARYTFTRPDWRLVPYVQAGAGIVYNDAYLDRTQRAIGQAQEFTLQAALGLHYLVSSTWSMDAEANYMHISNASLSNRNAGINALGGTIGVTYHFGKTCR